jgi:membrane protein CcdC involved in cytochrome C biogenesis
MRLSSLLPGLLAAAGAALVLAWRLRETRRPVSARSILLPPLGMSTGFSMFLLQDFRVPWYWALGSFAAGALLLAVPLIRSSRLALHQDTVVMRRSNAFIAVLLGLVAVRLLLREQVSALLPARQTAGVFFILAFGMITRWRAWMWLEYRKLTAVKYR